MTGRILVVEDERLSRSLTERLLTGLGFEVHAVPDGLEAVHAFVSHEFALVLMDCQMPRMDGFEATAAIREHEWREGLRRTPIVGLSGRCMPGDDDVAIRKGMDAYLTKPATSRRVQAVVEAFIGSS